MEKSAASDACFPSWEQEQGRARWDHFSTGNRISCYYWVITDRISRNICSMLGEGEYCLGTSPSTVDFKQRAKIWGEFPFEPWPPILSNLWILIHSTHITMTLLSSQCWTQILCLESSLNFGSLQAESVCSCQSSPAASHSSTCRNQSSNPNFVCKLTWTVFNCACRVYLISIIISPAFGASKTPQTNMRVQIQGFCQEPNDEFELPLTAVSFIAKLFLMIGLPVWWWFLWELVPFLAQISEDSFKSCLKTGHRNSH